MNSIQVYKNEEFNVRTVELNGIAYFIGKDVADALGYSDTQAMTRRLDSEDLMTDKLSGMNMKSTLINESGLYSAILGSHLPSAKKFKRWVTSEVLPSIRKYGMYATDELLTNPDIAIAVFTELKKEREEKLRLTETIAIQNQQILELKPKATYYDLVLNCKDLLSTTSIAKDYGLSAVRLNQILHDKKIQFKQGDIWLLYQKYADKGYTSTKTHNYPDSKGEVHTKLHTYWTPKGRLFIYELLKNSDIIPLIEKGAC